MRKLGSFLAWLYGGFDDSYTYLIWACVIGVLLVPSDWHVMVIIAVEVVTVGMRMWTRDVVAEKRRQKEEAP